MDFEYDSKFEEMKKYIPFLERMIKRLESTGTVSNPRQAQLDKIRSLRDLLLDKKKRMKMENLLKCEQVLVNLHAKVEQKESLPVSKKDPSDSKPTEKSDLNTVRKKLKSAVTKLQVETEETLPEIARASAIEEICVPGSKEPALFQRRPNMPSTDKDKFSPTKNKESKRNYTRVLLSPETSKKRWSDNENLAEKQLFCRRSPKISPRRISPTYYKKEKKKSKNKSKGLRSENLNITLNVPEDSLSSLNTKDILSRIINCSDGDVDIDTLRVLRKQILGELKNTGTKDDISDILLKSYKKRDKVLKKKEVEEGEISDSESEAIESIYGSLVIMDKEKSTSEVVLKDSDVEKPRKIQICLLINPDKSNGSSQEEKCKSIPIDICDFETFEKKSNESELLKEEEKMKRQDLNDSKDIDSLKGDGCEDKYANDVFDIENISEQSQIEKDTHKPENTNYDAFSKETKITGLEKETKPNFYTSNEEQDDNSEGKNDGERRKEKTEDKTSSENRLSDEQNMISNKIECNLTSQSNSAISNTNVTDTVNESILNSIKNKGTELNSSNDNLISSLLDSCNKQQNLSDDNPKSGLLDSCNKQQNPLDDPKSDLDSCNKQQSPDIDIPLLGPTNSTDVPLEPTKKVSEIDILQALKKEILSETTCALNSEPITPPLHQPKITKVINAQEIGTKKRISIESYKAKAYPSTKSITSNDNISNSARDDVAKKQSIKLTEKEFERFNLSKVSFDDSSDDEQKSNLSLDDIYSDLAPKSPDHEDFADTGLKPPVIIPSDPVKTAIVSSEADIDMRKLLPIPNSSISPSVSKENLPKLYSEKEVPKNDKQLQDPRKKRETSCVPESPNPYRINPENTPTSEFMNYANSSSQASNFSNLNTNSTSVSIPNATPTRVSMISPNMTTNVPNLNPNMTPNRTPNVAPSMTPNTRTYEMTPSRQPFDNDEFAPRKHVYTPIFVPSESRDFNENQRHQWDKSKLDQNQKYWEDIDVRNSSVQRDIDYRDPRSNSFNRDNTAFDQYQKGSMNDRFFNDNKLDCPSTPIHPFGRLDCPPTPNPSFGRMDCVNSSNNVFGRTDLNQTAPFGRMDCPNTPTPSFGRMDCPSTPTASFGRMDCPMTPIPSFGRAECPPTPNHPFGRSDCPLKPNHQFARSDCPSTPIHPFGRSDCPSTPNHPFGRPEQLHNTPFIRPDFGHNLSNNNYVKSQDPRLNRVPDYDKCYKRDDEREMGYFKDRNYNTDSYKSEYNNRRNTDQFRKFQREQSVSRNDRSKIFEKGIRNYRDSNRDSYGSRSFNREPDHSNRDYNNGRSYNRDYESERINSKNRGYTGRTHEYRQQNEYKKYDDYERRQYRREKSVSRKESAREAFSRSQIRDSSEETFRKENNLSVNPQEGHSFTIDTSINRTFQINDHHDFSFNARRERAASVGRTLVRDSRLDVFNENRISHVNKNGEDLKSKFRRASSVGREIKNNKLDFKEIKEDLRSYKFKENTSMSKELRNRANEVTAFKNHEPRSRRDIHDSYKSLQSNMKYSPKKNSRDPRMRREYESKGKFKDNDYRSNSYERNNYGIVYSNDNISKGNIMGPGYGVKNYKIPKIKRQQEDTNECSDGKTADDSIDTSLKNEDKKNVELKDEPSSIFHEQREGAVCSNIQNISNMTKNEPIANDSNCNNDSKIKEVNVQQDTKNIEEFSENNSNQSQNTEEQKTNITVETTSLENSEKRMTRSVAKNISYGSFEELDTSPVKRTRRTKRPLIIDSESDDNDLSENLSNSLVDRQHLNTTTTKSIKEISLVNNFTETNLKNDKVTINDQPEVKNKKNNTKNITSPNNFIDDLEIFSDNVVSDPVIDNINDLIAGLDHDLESAKEQDNSNFTKELNLETMLENITSPQECDNKDGLPDEIVPLDQKENDLNSIVITQAQNSDDNNKENTKQNSAISSNNSDLSEMSSEDYNKACRKEKPYKVNNLDIVDNRSNEPIVSTSGYSDKQERGTELESKVSETEFNIQSTPDSTIGSNETDANVEFQKGLPDSTNDTQCEMHSDISSTHITTETVNSDIIQASSSNKASDQIETFGKLLSMLQDKNKIKELLGLLGDHSSENDKIKKKLEKLSEIVSDDEDTAKESSSEIMDANVDDSKNEKSLSDDQNQATNSKINELEILQNQHSIEKMKTIEKEDLLKQNKEEPHSDSIPNENQSIESATVKITKSVLAVANESKTEIEVASADKSEKPFICSKEVNKEEIIFGNSSKIPCVVPPAVVNDGQVKNNIEEEIPSANETNTLPNIELLRQAEKTPKKSIKTGFSKRGRRKNFIKSIPVEQKRITRSDVANLRFEKSARKKPTELQKLQDDIREMFIKDDILNATGIRMCRIAKLVDDKRNEKCDQNPAESNIIDQSVNQGPVVVLEKFNNLKTADEISSNTSKKSGVKRGKRIKVNDRVISKCISLDPEDQNASPQLTSDTYIKSGLKTKTNIKDKTEDNDPYAFETDSINRSENTSNVDNDIERDESESESLGSSKSFGSTELLTEVKKKIRRKRSAWMSGIIKRKNKKKKPGQKNMSSLPSDETIESQNTKEKPCAEPFTDKTYCFNKNQSSYDCRLCSYSGTEIVNHYKKQHPHSEIPLSRMNSVMAKAAIKESQKLNFQAVSKISSKKYVCRFCFEEIGNKKPVLEAFFWHVVSMHTGEYKQICTECVNITRCPFNLDIPPPPKESKGQLLGYICEKCNYTQISLENLKSHVIMRHNDEQTAVYTINLAVMSKKNVVLDIIQKTRKRDKHTNSFESDNRLLRSSRSNHSYAESSDVMSDTTEESSQYAKTKSKENEDEPKNEGNFKVGIQSKITFENDNVDELSNFDDNDTCNIKIEQEINENQDDFNKGNEKQLRNGKQTDNLDNMSNKSEVLGDPISPIPPSNDVFDYPHFKIKYTETGSKEYICCINGNDLHYKTTLLISLKKHVQLKHLEPWDGYCYACKVIVTPQGVYYFKDCLQHFLDNHSNFPILEETSEKYMPLVHSNISNEISTTPLSYINVRPMTDLISKTIPDSQQSAESSRALPIIESVVSLGSGIEQPRPSPTYPSTEQIYIKKQYKYEEVQAETMSKKHRVVLDAMMTSIKLVHVFKCAGRFCSFTTDSAEDALLHASTHMRVGGENSLDCVYCDYDASNNAVDLVTHVFKSHGPCQYVCCLCFYRAATVHLVDAHIKRVHENATNKQILHTSFHTGPITDEGILPRETSVPFYKCMAGIGTDAECKYRTYTPGKFAEHLNMKHISDKEFTCCVCPSTLTTPSDLVSHIKTHGLKLYQCVWCVYGSDNEAGLLAHSSSLHPDKFPKAYLRIITNKEGTKERRVLPLAPLNKLEISSVEVSPTNFKENPVRVAVRSTELEKLISQTALMIESTTVEESEPIPNLEPDIQPSVLEDLSPEKSLESTTNNSASPPPNEEINRPRYQLSTLESEDVKPVINEPPKPIPEVVCLDSDEEDNIKNVIDLSDDATTSSQNTDNQKDHAMETKTLPLTELFLCSKCKMTFKMGSGFKKHVISCFGSALANVPCAHCPITVKMKEVIHHYTRMHSERASMRFSCLQCSLKLNSLAQLREHVRSEHSPVPAVVPSASANIKNKPGPKRRKRSLGSKEKAVEPPEKVKKFGPHDINLLPINPILDQFVFCSLCEFSTKVRHNMVRHLQLHAEQQPVPQTAPVNPVPHLESNEKHFDKMVNLASSSILPRTEKSKPDSVPSTIISSEAASRYPKHVPEKHRLTCGAIGCSYISVDESMLKRHWEALHTGTNNFLCVHCPPYQHLDTTKPLTASRIIGHLKMHDTNLYACSICPYYHYRRQILDHHLAEMHKGSGQVMIVREEKTVAVIPTPPPQPSATPTMDLKPWQCGLCKYKSLLRQEVVDHCAKVHNSKMQYKCAYCAFRTSNTENITKHQSKSHSGRTEEIFYFYYQEGSVPEEADGTPRWQRQSQKMGTTESKIKSEPAPSENLLLPTITNVVSLPQTPPNQSIDLNLVKKEAIEAHPESTESLCKEFGEFCEPNGLNYKCSLCKHVIEDTAEAMQSHLYEELKYRKWGCSICSYKAFHKAGLNEHMQIEHRQNREPVALEINVRIELWVAKLLEHQTALIAKNKENLAKQKEEIFRPVPGTPTKPQVPVEIPSTSKKLTMTELEKTFGSFGTPVNMSFCCPKCKVLFKEEDAMQNHLESELNKIRWFCSECFVTFQTYHEAQFHCRSSHSGTFPRPVEVVRDASVRSSWVEAVIRVQKLSMNYVPLQKHLVPDPEPLDSESDNSLLVVRYEERVPTPGHQTAASARPASPDSDDGKLVIAEPKEPNPRKKNCSICNYSSSNVTVVRHHILRHYELKPFMCGHCDFNSNKRGIVLHHKNRHPKMNLIIYDVKVPDESPEEYLAKQPIGKNGKVICLVCRKVFNESETKQHIHNNVVPTYGKKNDVVAKCAICLTLHKDVDAYYEHHSLFHEQVPRNYVFTKLNTIENESKEMVYACGICTYKFGNMVDLKTHVNSIHGGCLLYSVVPKYQQQVPNEIQQNETPQNQVIDVEAIGAKRKSVDAFVNPPFKRIAKKSTTKLPLFKSCARKSTTKLPFDVASEPEEFSYYGTRPDTEGFENVTALMPFCNALVPFSLQKLNEIINIYPIVRVRKE